MKNLILLSLASITVTLDVLAQVRLVEAFPHLSFVDPVDLQHAGDGSNRLFAVEQAGVIRVFENSFVTTSSKVFLNIQGKVTSGGERGLLGLAFHPNFTSNGYFYVNYTRQTDSLRTYVSRFSVSPTNPDSADAESELVLLTVTQPFSNHNGGQIAFGPDSYLYVALGDGGGAGDTAGNAQNRATLLGSILRIDVDTPSGGRNYSIPPDNPFVGNATGYREEIFAYGLRNPWRFSFDPATGNLWCADVGQSSREEINIVEAGNNYGWNIMEGTLCYNPSTGCTTTGLTLPVWEYGRAAGGSVTGGFVYRGPLLPALQGKYVYGDYVSGRVWALMYDGVNPTTNALLDSLGQFSVSSFGIDENNELYVCDHRGKLYKFISDPPVSVKQEETLIDFRLEQNYPNPFNSVTTVHYSLPVGRNARLRSTSDEQVIPTYKVTLSVYNLLGEEIAKLVDEQKQPGSYEIRWDAGSNPSGIYVYRLAVTRGDEIRALHRKMALVR
jgi:glucose/arabinose dehydrogenase